MDGSRRHMGGDNACRAGNSIPGDRVIGIAGMGSPDPDRDLIRPPGFAAQRLAAGRLHRRSRGGRADSHVRMVNSGGIGPGPRRASRPVFAR